MKLDENIGKSLSFLLLEKGPSIHHIYTGMSKIWCTNISTCPP